MIAGNSRHKRKNDMEKLRLRLKAIDRVQSSLLKPYKDILIDNHPNYDEHIKWVATAPFSEVLSWCKMTKDLADNSARLPDGNTGE